MSRQSQDQTVSLFPFLAVLVCAMGALIFLLLVTTRKIRDQKREIAAATAAEAAAEVREAMQQAVIDSVARREAEAGIRDKLAVIGAEKERAQRRIALLQQALQDAEQQRQNAEAELAEIRSQKLVLEQRTAALAEETDRLTGQLRAAEADAESQRRQATAEHQAEEQRLRNRLASARTEHTDAVAVLDEHSRLLADAKRIVTERRSAVETLRELADEAQQQAGESAAVTMLTFTNPDGTSADPILVEAGGEGIRFPPYLQTLQAENLVGTRGVYNPLIAGIRTLHRLRNDAVSEPKPLYVLLLVRPGGIREFVAVELLLRDADIPYGYELLDDTEFESLAFAEPDASEEYRLRRALLAAVAQQRHAVQRFAHLFAQSSADPLNEDQQGPNTGAFDNAERSGAARSADAAQPSDPERVGREGRNAYGGERIPDRYYAGGHAPRYPPRGASDEESARAERRFERALAAVRERERRERDSESDHAADGLGQSVNAEAFEHGLAERDQNHQGIRDRMLAEVTTDSGQNRSADNAQDAGLIAEESGPGIVRDSAEAHSVRPGEPRGQSEAAHTNSAAVSARSSLNPADTHDVSEWLRVGEVSGQPGTIFPAGAPEMPTGQARTGQVYSEHPSPTQSSSPVTGTPPMLNYPRDSEAGGSAGMSAPAASLPWSPQSGNAGPPGILSSQSRRDGPVLFHPVTIYLDAGWITVESDAPQSVRGMSEEKAVALLLDGMQTELNSARRETSRSVTGERLSPLFRFVVSPGAEPVHVQLANRLAERGYYSRSVVRMQRQVDVLRDYHAFQEAPNSSSRNVQQIGPLFRSPVPHRASAETEGGVIYEPVRFGRQR